MDKRTFLKTSGALVGGAMLSSLSSCNPEKEHLKNWSGNLEYGTDQVYYPKSVEEVQDVIKKLPKLRGLGSRHSFNKIADSVDNLVSFNNLNKVVSLDKINHTVTVEAGMKYGEVCQYLHENGYALHNLASLPHISIAGSVATATHGSGVKNGNLSTAVSAIEFVNGKGEIVSLSKKDGDAFYGAVVGLGSLGLVTKVTLDLQPTFMMKQLVYRNLPMEQLEKNFMSIMSSGYSVSLFTDWQDKNVSEVWIKSRVEEGSSVTNFASEFFGAKLATKNLHPIEDQPAENCTDQMGVPGPWYERMPHFKMGFTPSAGKELQSEYFVPIEQAYEAMMAVEKLKSETAPHIFISEIRTIDADDLWMSPCYKKPCVALHTTWKQNWDAVINLLPKLEQQLAPFNPRPHWAKLFTLKPSVLQSRIERLGDFKQLLNLHDPEGKFRNEFIDSNLF
ncbi:MAG TPA: FAD-binding protein [Cyclobacteriaceae bacterium]